LSDDERSGKNPAIELLEVAGVFYDRLLVTMSRWPAEAIARALQVAKEHEQRRRKAKAGKADKADS
jgi:hypothetical protein